MKVYVAGSSRERDRVDWAMGVVTGLGATIAHDWTKSIDEARSRGCEDGDLTNEERASRADDDAEGIEAANVFWQLIPTTPTKGAWIEYGIACGLRRVERRISFSKLEEEVDAVDELERVCNLAPDLIIVSGGSPNGRSIFLSKSESWADFVLDADQQALEVLQSFKEELASVERFRRVIAAAKGATT